MYAPQSCRSGESLWFNSPEWHDCGAYTSVVNAAHIAFMHVPTGHHISCHKPQSVPRA
jgi:hypothetical protein